MTSETSRPVTGGSGAARARIFGIGLNKTGTTSLHAALTILGFESLHWGGPAIREAVEAARDTGAPLLSNLDARYDALSDIEALSTAFATLDRQYPGSRFVLTVRPVDEWVDSRRRHVETNVLRKARGEYNGTFLVVEESAWREKWEEHLGLVHAHFRGRHDFLEMDLSSGSGWSPLCELLEVDTPAASFPWANQGSAALREQR